MSAGAIARRRGACPGLSAPMPTGDGLLVRLIPIGTIALDAFARLCAAARTHGNGVIEVTARGSVQIRGLTPASAPRFAAAIAALEIAADDGIPVLTNPLAGIGAQEILDAGALAADLRRTLSIASITTKLATKVSVVVDGGGAPSLDALSADIRLRAEAVAGSVVLRVSVGGDGATATHVGVVAPTHAVAAVMGLLEIIANRGRDARARDVLTTDGVLPFRDALASCLAFRPATASDPPGETKDGGGRDDRGGDDGGRRRAAIGTHVLRDGSLACGIGLGFGHANSQTLEAMIEAATGAGASGVRAAPGRVLIVIGPTPAAAASFLRAAERLGFIVRADDPRRHVVACAGAPACASAHIAARVMAPSIAAVATPLVSQGLTVHVSGCVKGCAHPGPAALTIAGTAAGCALIANGRAGDNPERIVPTSELSEAVAGAARSLAAEAHHG
jgi:precorrin-3B synthase